MGRITSRIVCLSGKLPSTVLTDLLTHIPGNTSVESVTKQYGSPAIFDVVMNNPLFTDGTEIYTEYQRKYIHDDQGNPVELDLFMGIRIHNNPGSQIQPGISSTHAQVAAGSMGCNHNWATYHGLTDKYDYCTICGIKKP